jgi:hypothetical protein
MNTAEHVVECYFRLVRKCFTAHDVKVKDGNGRQFDLLAISLQPRSYFHVESSVTHGERWNPTPEKLVAIFERKFFGEPPVRDGKNTDHARGKRYWDNILETYRSFGVNPERLQRVFCCWTPPAPSEVATLLRDIAERRSIRPIKLLSFRDVVIPELEKAVSTSNYEDEPLRMLSLLQQRRSQLPE